MGFANKMSESIIAEIIFVFANCNFVRKLFAKQRKRSYIFDVTP